MRACARPLTFPSPAGSCRRPAQVICRPVHSLKAAAVVGPPNKRRPVAQRAKDVDSSLHSATTNFQFICDRNQNRRLTFFAPCPAGGLGLRWPRDCRAIDGIG